MSLKRIFFAVLPALAICAGVLGLMLLWEGLQTVRDFHREGMLTVEHTNRLLIVAGGMVGNVEKSTRAVEAAATEQRAYWREISKQTNSDLEAFHSLILSANDAAKQITNSSVRIEKEASGISAASVDSIKRVGDTIASLQPGIQALTETAQNASKLVADPHLPATFAHLDGAAADFHVITTDTRRVVHKAANDYLTPKGKLTLAGKVFLSNLPTFVYIAFHFL